MADNPAELLTAHHLPYRVVNVIEDVREFVVLVTAYFQAWTHLDHAVRAAVERGVKVTAILRAPDGSQRERDKQRDNAEHLQQLGAKVHFVDRLHAKAYINEAQAIVTSFNLVHASQDSIELGVHIQDPDLVQDCLRKIAAYCPDMCKPSESPARSPARRAATGSPSNSRQQPQLLGPQAYCIGCADPLDLDPAKPLCRSCYRSSRRGLDLAALPKRACHFCGSPHDSALDRPLCLACWKSLSPEQQVRLKSAIA